MKTIIFVCHGNICRSPAAEFIAKDYLKKHNLEKEFRVISRATSFEEIGNDIYPPMKEVLRRHDVPISRHYATRISKTDYDSADYIFYMDDNNKNNLMRMFPDAMLKCYKISIYAGENFEDVEDPWYTGRYETVYMELYECIQKLFALIK